MCSISRCVGLVDRGSKRVRITDMLLIQHMKTLWLIRRLHTQAGAGAGPKQSKNELFPEVNAWSDIINGLCKISPDIF